MSRRAVDRGHPIVGIQKTARDHKVPFNAVRALQNFRLPDKRLRRRRGFDEYSTTRIHGNQLAKHSGSKLQQSTRKDVGASNLTRDPVWKTPLSYGVIKWHDDFQPKVGRDFTLEMLVTIGEEEPLVSFDPQPAAAFPVSSGFNRISPTRNSGAYSFLPRGISGVFVYDQCIIANECTFNDGAGDITLPTNPDSSAVTNPVMWDTVSLPALSIAYNKAIDGADDGKVRFEVEWTIVDSVANKYYRFGTAGLLKYAHETYVAGTTYHVAVTYSIADNFVRLYLDGVLVATSTDILRGLGANAKWSGEDDRVNGITARGTTNGAIHRDIVLLNECTARGNYASTCSFLNRGATVSTNAGDWTYQLFGAEHLWWIQLNGNLSPKAVYYHDRTPAAPAQHGITTTYGKEEATQGALDASKEWWWDDPNNKLYIRTGSAVSDPVTFWKEVEIIFDFIGSPNLIPHIPEGSISSGPNTAQISQPNPWACSPPRGTAISELRIWHKTRTAVELLADKLVPLNFLSGNDLKGYWRMRDGGSILVDTVNGRKLSVHHGHAAWVKDLGLLGGLGLTLSDGQHLIKSFDSSDSSLYKDDIHTYLDSFLHQYQDPVADSYTTDISPDAHADFTAQIQIRTPHSWQQDIARHSDWTKGQSWPLFDGSQGTRQRIGEFSDIHGPGGKAAQVDGHRQTLFSVEGSVVPPDPTIDTQYKDTRVRLLGAFIDDAGFVRFEQSARYHNTFAGNAELYQLAAGSTKRVDDALYTGGVGVGVKAFTAATAPFTAGDTGMLAVVRDADDAVKFVSRVTYVSPTVVNLEWYWAPAITDTITIFNPLDKDTVYTITCRKKTEDRGATGATAIFSSWMDIFINDVLVISGRCARSGFIFHEKNYAVSVGASMVDDVMDASVCADSILFTGRNILVGKPPFGANPWPLNHSSQHFMTHHQDEPGDFVLGFFRLWAGLGIDDVLVETSWNSSLESKYHDPQLVFNLEVDQMTGTDVPNRCRYPAIFKMGYKSFGGTLNQFLASAAVPSEAHVLLGWEAEDRLGHIPQPAAFDNKYEEASGKMLAPFSSTLRQQGGVLALFDDCLLFDGELTGGFATVHLPVSGMMNDFTSGGFWEGVVIGDRTVMIGFGGLPKVFNGRVCTKAGMGTWNGGLVKAQVEAGGKLTKNRWYHLRLVYHDDYDQLQSVSPPIIFQTNDTNLTVRLKNIPQHPDPRITSVRVYATGGHVSRDLALGSSPRLTQLGAIENVNYSGGDSGILYGDLHADDDLLPAILALDVMPVPLMTTATSHNGRLVGGGNPLVPDAFFWSLPGNPETFLESSIGILEEGTGDRIVKILSAFGSVFVFKTNSIWRLDETQPGALNPWTATKLVDGIGCVTSRAVTFHVDPDTGRSFIFFWSKHGPYIFDGVNIIYVGQPLEQGLDNPAWDWIDTTSAFLIHDITEREIISYAKLADSDRTDVAYSFNYRFSNFETGEFAWSEYTGVVGEVGLTLLVTDDESQVVTVLGTNVLYTPLITSFEDRFFPLVASSNGRIYKWGNSDYDGHPGDGGDYASRHTISTYAAGIITVAGAPVWGDFRGIWVSVVKADHSDSYVWPVKFNTASAFTFDDAYGTRPFEPVAGDYIYIGRAPATVEFPWDMLDVPFTNKEVHRVLLWMEKDFYYRWMRDWTTTWEKPFTLVADRVGKRQHVDLAPSPSCEVFKLELRSFEIDSRVDSYAYIITPTGAEDIPQ